MSFIRFPNEPAWVDDADVDGLYVYSDGDALCYMPTEEKQFVEVVMRMLDQSGELSDETLQDVYAAFAVRFRWVDPSERDTSRNTTQTDAYFGLNDAVVWFDKQDAFDDEYEQALQLRDEIEP